MMKDVDVLRDVKVTGRFSKLVYQFPIRIPERPVINGHEAVERCPGNFSLYRIFFYSVFFSQKDDN